MTIHVKLKNNSVIKQRTKGKFFTMKKITFRDFETYHVTFGDARAFKRNIKRIKAEVGCTLEAILDSARNMYRTYGNAEGMPRPSMSTVAKLFSNRIYITYVTPLTECICSVFGVTAADVISLQDVSNNKANYLAEGVDHIVTAAFGKTMANKIHSVDSNSAVTIIRFEEDVNDEPINVANILDAIARYLPESTRYDIAALFKNAVETKNPCVFIKTDWLDEAIQTYGKVLAGLAVPATVGIIDRELSANMANSKVGLRLSDIAETHESGEDTAAKDKLKEKSSKSSKKDNV